MLTPNRLAFLPYSRMPVAVQNVGISLWGLRLNRMRYGRYFRKYFAELRRAERQDEQWLRERQRQRLKRLVAHAQATVPYYEELF